MPVTRSKEKNRAQYIAGIAFTVAWLIFIPLSKNLFINAEDRLQSLISIMLPVQPGEPSVTVVDIDDSSLHTVGQWPWPRYILGNLLNALRRHSTQVIGLDILFSESDRTSLDYIRQRYKTEFGIDMSYIGVPKGMLDNDAYLASVLRNKRPVVGSVQLKLAHHHDTTLIPPYVTANHIVPQAESIIKNIPIINDALTRNGFVNFFNNQDGILHSIPMLIDTPEGVLPSFTLAMLMEKEHVSKIKIEDSFWGCVINVGQYKIPIDNEGRAWLNFYPNDNNYVSVPAAAILAGTPITLPEPFILIGSTAAALHDNVMTPSHRNTPGVGIHATLLNNIINNQLIIHPVWILNWHELTCILLLGLTNILYFKSVSFAQRTFTVLLSVLLAFAVMVGALYFYNIWLPVIYCIPGMLILTFIHEIIEYIVLRKNLSIWKEDLENTNHALLHAMAAICDTRDPETGGHISRTQHYVKCLAEWLHEQGHPEAQSPFFVDALFHAAPLHDVGKVAIPDSILLKPGRLTVEEFNVIKSHTSIGKRLLSDTADKLREPGIFLRCAIDIAGSHHERWDGKGYPEGLTGTDIPFSARVMAVADVYDALISNRVYKEGMSHEQAAAIIAENSGLQFDPSVVTAFLHNGEAFQRISTLFMDE